MNIYGVISGSVLCLLCATLFFSRQKLADKLRNRSKLVFNEQAKLLATALNNISVALIVGGMIVEDRN